MKIPSGPTLGPIHFSPSSGPKAVVVHGAGPLIATAERGGAAEKSLMSCQPDLSSFLPHSRLATEKVGNIISFGCKLHVFRSRFQQFGLTPVDAPLTGSSSLIYDTALISVRRICVRIDPEAAVEPNLFFKKKENQWKNKNSIDDTFRPASGLHWLKLHFTRPVIVNIQCSSSCGTFRSLRHCRFHLEERHGQRGSHVRA